MSDSPSSAAAAPQQPAIPSVGAAALARDLEAAAIPHESPFRTRVLAAVDRPLAGGFAATLGVLGALVLGSALLSISTILVYIVLALFLALGLDPIVRMLERHKVSGAPASASSSARSPCSWRRSSSSSCPRCSRRSASSSQAIPQALDEMPESEWFLALPAEWQVGLGTAIEQLAATLSDPAFLAVVGGGVLAVAAGIIGAISAASSSSH